MAELSKSIRKRIEQLCAAGDGRAATDDYAAALGSYRQALELVPDPKTDWEEAAWIFAAIGDAYFHAEDFAAGRNHFTTALQCPGSAGNPFLHLRLGQCQYEVGDTGQAAVNLGRALIGGGKDLFEDEDAKYIRFISPRARQPK